MTVKILNSSSSFHGVSYNTNKTDRAKGELMKVSGFGYLQAAETVQKEEYKTYLKAWSAANRNVQHKQFHAVISCKERNLDKYQLTQIATRYMQEMGYGDNPYLIVYHKDTANNHVHIVSSRIGKDGKKINDSFEHSRSIKVIEKIMQIAPEKEAAAQIVTALGFNFSTTNQFKLLLEQQGYRIAAKEGSLVLRKNDSIQGSVQKARINERLACFTAKKERTDQLSKIFQKYKDRYDPTIRVVFKPGKYGQTPKPVGYRSDLADFLKEKFGITLIYHGQDGKTPYGYTVIDHPHKNIFKGGEVLALKKLLAVAPVTQPQKKISAHSYSDGGIVHQLLPGREVCIKPLSGAQLADMQAVLKSAVHEFASIQEGLAAYGIQAYRHQDRTYILDVNGGAFISLDVLLQGSDRDTSLPIEQSALFASASQGMGDQISPALLPLNILAGAGISDDVDDEKVHGRKRRRQQTTKTTTR